MKISMHMFFLINFCLYQKFILFVQMKIIELQKKEEEIAFIHFVYA